MPDNLYYIELAWEIKVPQEKILNKFKINPKKVLKFTVNNNKKKQNQKENDIKIFKIKFNYNNLLYINIRNIYFYDK